MSADYKISALVIRNLCCCNSLSKAALDTVEPGSVLITDADNVDQDSLLDLAFFSLKGLVTSVRFKAYQHLFVQMGISQSSMYNCLEYGLHATWKLLFHPSKDGN